MFIKKMNIYCGNNASEMKRRRKRLGSPYECLRKGIGAGLHGDISNFDPDYKPIFVNDIFCGNKSPPPGKKYGTPSECLRKGFGIGQKMQYDKRPKPPPDTRRPRRETSRSPLEPRIIDTRIKKKVIEEEPRETISGEPQRETSLKPVEPRIIDTRIKKKVIEDTRIEEDPSGPHRETSRSPLEPRIIDTRIKKITDTRPPRIIDTRIDSDRIIDTKPPPIWWLIFFAAAIAAIAYFLFGLGVISSVILGLLVFGGTYVLTR